MPSSLNKAHLREVVFRTSSTQERNSLSGGKYGKYAGKYGFEFIEKCRTYVSYLWEMFGLYELKVCGSIA